MCLEEHLKQPQGQAMYAVVKGEKKKKKKKKSRAYLTDLPFDGFVIGGSVEEKARGKWSHTLRRTMTDGPEEHPNHLLGIGDLEPSSTPAFPSGSIHLTLHRRGLPAMDFC